MSIASLCELFVRFVTRTALESATDGFDDFDDGLAPRSRDASVDDAHPQDFQDADWARGSWAQDDLDLSDESVWNLPGPASADADAFAGGAMAGTLKGTGPSSAGSYDVITGSGDKTLKLWS